MTCQSGILVILWLTVEKPWSALTGLFLSFLTQTGIEKAPLPLEGSISGTADSFQAGEAFTGWTTLTIVSSLMSGCGRGHDNLHLSYLQPFYAYLEMTQSSAKSFCEPIPFLDPRVLLTSS